MLLRRDERRPAAQYGDLHDYIVLLSQYLDEISQVDIRRAAAAFASPSLCWNAPCPASRSWIAEVPWMCARATLLHLQGPRCSLA